MINNTTGTWVTAGTLVLFAVMGIAVLAVRSRRASNRSFAMYALASSLAGTAFVLFWGQPGTVATVGFFATGPLYAVAAIGVIGLAVRFPTRLRADEVPFVWWAAAVAVVLMALAFIGDTIAAPEGYLAAWTREAGSVWAWRSVDTGNNLYLASITFLSVLAPLRASRTPPDGPSAGEYAVMAVAVGVWQAVLVGNLLPLGPPFYDQTISFLIVIPTILVPVALWLRLLGRYPLVARRAAWALLGAMLFGLVVTVFFGGFVGALNSGLFGAIRFVSLAILGLAIVRHQILGLDVKIRWTVSRSTVAAAFIAVFFVVSELAAEIFGGAGLGPILGILAAGLLVFFLAPLQRWADRVAATTTGDAKAPSLRTPDEKTTIYRRTVMAAWSDGSIDVQERLLLDELRDGLGLSPEEAAALESQAARVVGGVANGPGA